MREPTARLRSAVAASWRCIDDGERRSARIERSNLAIALVAGRGGSHLPGVAGHILGAMTAAGAFAAFMSTSSGLLISIAGTVSYDVWGRGGRGVCLSVRRRRFRVVAMAGMAIPAVIALAVQPLAFAAMIAGSLASAAPVDVGGAHARA